VVVLFEDGAGLESIRGPSETISNLGTTLGAMPAAQLALTPMATYL